MQRRDLMWLAGLAAPCLCLSLPAHRGRQGAADRLPEVRLAGAAQGARPARAAAGAGGLVGRLDRVPGRPAAARGAQCRRDRLRHHRRGAADLRPGRRRTAALCRPRAAGTGRRGDPGPEGVSRSPTWPASRAGRSPSTRAPTSSTCWCGRWQAAGLGYADIEPVYLPPADARAAFERGAVDAWAIWDPFLAAAQAATGARTLVDGTGLVSNHQFYLAAQPFAAAHPAVVQAILADIGDTDRWAAARTRRGRGPAGTARRHPAPPCSRWPWAGSATACSRWATRGRGAAADRRHLPRAGPAAQADRRARRSSGRPRHDGRGPRPPTSSGSCPRTATAAIWARPRVRARSTCPTCARSPRPPTISAISACCCRPGARARIPGSSPRRWHR